MGMKRLVLKEDEGKFGKITADDKRFEKTLYGRIFYVDRFGAVIFIDNDDIAYRFSANTIREFTEEELKIKT